MAGESMLGWCKRCTRALHTSACMALLHFLCPLISPLLVACVGTDQTLHNGLQLVFFEWYMAV